MTDGETARQDMVCRRNGRIKSGTGRQYKNQYDRLDGFPVPSAPLYRLANQNRGRILTDRCQWEKC